MANPNRRKGDRAELEVQALWREHTGYGRRALGAGRLDDVGDIHGIPGPTIVQVVNWKDVAAAVRAKPNEVERQRQNAKTGSWVDDENGATRTFEQVPAPFACTFVRLKGGEYRVVMTVDQFMTMWREAING